MGRVGTRHGVRDVVGGVVEIKLGKNKGHLIVVWRLKKSMLNISLFFIQCQ